MKSPQFREFMKYLTKGRTYAKKGPDLKKLLTCKEYRECEIKKTVTVEIRELVIPLGKNEERGLKMLLLLVAKN